MKIKRGSTSVRRLIFIADTSKTDGSGLANLVHNTSGLVAYYFAGDLSNEVQITLATATLGAWVSGGFVAVDNTNMPGWYEIGIPDAALDGGNEVAIQLRGAANMAPVNIYIELDTVDYQTAAFGAALATHWTATRAGYLDGVLISTNFSNRTVQVTGGPNPHIAADVHAFQNGVITTAAFAAGAITSGVIATDAIGSDELAASAVTKIQLGLGLASANLDTQLSGIQADTNDIQSRLPAALISGRMDSNVQAIAAGVVTQIQAGLSTLTAAQVNAEVLDVLATDLFGELAAVPGASSSLKDKIAFLFMLARNKVTQTSSTQTLFADNTTTPVAAATTSDVGGTFTRGEFA